MNHYPHHLGDYAKDTIGLTQGQHGAYRLLLDASYATEQGIPSDEVYGVTKATTPAERKNTDKVLAKYFVLADGRYIQKRVQAEIEVYRSKSRKASESAARRWGKPVDNPSEPMPSDMRTHERPHKPPQSGGSAEAMLAINQEPESITTAFPVMDTSRPEPRKAEAESKPDPHPPSETRTAGLAALLRKARVTDVDSARALMDRWLEIATDHDLLQAVNDACRSRGGQPFVAAYLDPIVERIVEQSRRTRAEAEAKVAKTQAQIEEQRHWPQPSAIPASAAKYLPRKFPATEESP